MFTIYTDQSFLLCLLSLQTLQTPQSKSLGVIHFCFSWFVLSDRRPARVVCSQVSWNISLLPGIPGGNLLNSFTSPLQGFTLELFVLYTSRAGLILFTNAAPRIFLCYPKRKERICRVATICWRVRVGGWTVACSAQSTCDSGIPRLNSHAISQEFYTQESLLVTSWAASLQGEGTSVLCFIDCPLHKALSGFFSGVLSGRKWSSR
jgi:hypothetical protein